MALSARQTKLYRQRVDVWRGETETAADGDQEPREWSRVVTALPCYLETGTSQMAPLEVGWAESDNMFTFDSCHMEAGANVQEGDILRVVSGTEAGEYRTCQGEPTVRELHANKQKILVNRPLRVPQQIADFYA